MPVTSRPPRPRAEWLLRAAATIGLAVSVLLLFDYTRPISGLCDAGGGCDVIKGSAFARPLGVPTPLLGAGFFAAALAAAMLPRARRWLAPLTLAGAAVSLALVAVQALVLGAFCRWCLVADASALVLAGCALAVRGAPPLRPTTSSSAATAALVVAALIGPMVWTQAHPLAPPPAPVVTAGVDLPEVVAREQRPGVLTIVEFMDFECPFCRRLHEELAIVLDEYGGRVRVVRKMTPLTNMHPHALDAALAWCCADEAGRGDAMADALVRSDDLTRAACKHLAARLGLDTARFDACIDAPATRARVDRERTEASAAGVTGLPTYWIGTTKYSGAPDRDRLRQRIDAALRASGS